MSKNYKIQFVYFDLGGVVIRDFSGTNKWEELRTSIGITSENRAAFDALWIRHQDRLGTDFDVDWYIPEIEKECGISFPKNFSLLDEFVNRFEKIEHIHAARILGWNTFHYDSSNIEISNTELLKCLR